MNKSFVISLRAVQIDLKEVLPCLLCKEPYKLSKLSYERIEFQRFLSSHSVRCYSCQYDIRITHRHVFVLGYSLLKSRFYCYLMNAL